MVKIRLSRVGRTHAPVYRIVAIDSRKKRDGEALEILGTYNPFTKELEQFHKERIDAWVSKGAVVTDSVKKLQRLNDKNGGKPVKQAPEKKAQSKPKVKIEPTVEESPAV